MQNCKDPKAKNAKEYRQTLEDVFRERLLPLKVPVVAGLPFGHIPLNATLPVGVRVTLDAVKGDLRHQPSQPCVSSFRISGFGLPSAFGFRPLDFSPPLPASWTRT